MEVVGPTAVSSVALITGLLPIYYKYYLRGVRGWPEIPELESLWGPLGSFLVAIIAMTRVKLHAAVGYFANKR